MISIPYRQLIELQKHLNAIQDIINNVCQQTAQTPSAKLSMPYRAMTKAELAALAGVTSRTFAKWLLPYRQQLRKFGVADNAKLLPPAAVQYLCELFVIQ